MKRRLNKESYQKAVNVDNFNKIELTSKTNLLPVGNIFEVVSAGEQFNKERQESSLYRLSGSINPLFTNVLFNTTDTSSWKMFNSAIFRDGTYPTDTVSADQEEDLTYSESIDENLKVNNGWYGYRNPEDDNNSICSWIDMEPNRSLFTLSPENRIKNWELVITYPAPTTYTITDNMILGGILLTSVSPTTIGGREMVTFSTPIKHGLTQDDKVKIIGLNNTNVVDGIFTVIRLGKSNGDNKEYNFSIELPHTTTVNNSRVIRQVNGVDSSYYYRMFKTINVKGDELMKANDYETFPLAFSQTLFEDKVNEFVINNDIDISKLKDNRGRPLSEIFVTLIKTSSDGVFTNVKSGVEIPYNSEIKDKKDISDIRRITNDISSHKELESNVNVSDNLFYGDIVEYNSLELRETVLSEVHHRFNTYNREAGGTVPSPNFIEGEDIDLTSRQEGYMYKPHHRIKIREFSTYIEEGSKFTLNLPSYATNLKNGKFIWRDLLDVGVNDMNEDFLDYPFLNGCHYINTNISFPLKRQDPFNLYGLQYTLPPTSITGKPMNNDIITKTSQDVC